MTRYQTGAAFLVGLLLAVVSPVMAQQAPPARDEPATKFEQFLLTKGTVRVREFYDIGRLQGIRGEAKIGVARAYTPGKADSLFALRVEVKESGRLQRNRVGVLDVEEAASLVVALPQMSKMVEVLKQGQTTHNTEVDFRGGSLKIGVFVSMQGGATDTGSGLFIQAGEIGAISAFLTCPTFPNLKP